MGVAKYYDLPKRNGRENMGGFSVVAYFAPLSAFTTIKDVKTTTNPGDSVTIDGAHVFAAGKGLIKCFTTLDTAKLATETVGERGGKSHKITGEFVYPGMSKLGAELARNCVNDEFLLFLKDINPGGKFIQVGTKDLPAEIMPKFDSGTVSSGRKGFTFSFESYALSMLFYESDPELTLDATFASTGGLEDAETYIG